ncbi:MAG: stage V sporulation protein AD, partial [Clostridiales bacterium]|nr:stage V sporulation protein AD [Clostridiales bacterium]
NMGAAMAPAAYDTIDTHLKDTGRSSSFYDLIVTGDLGKLGQALVVKLFDQDGVELSNYNDCGLMLYDLEDQDVHCGGSGCGCSAAVLTGLLLEGLRSGQWENILFCGTGALHSPTALGQGESIPGICHAVALSARR